MESLKGKRLLVLGGSTWKEAILSIAREHDIYLIAAAPYHVGIFDIADESHLLDVTNPEVMVPFIKEHQIDGVYMGGSEPVINSACKYINELGLPCYCSQEQWQLVQNKHQFKALCQKYGLPVVPKYELDKDNLEGGLHSKAFPVVLKPADGCGSSGFSVCKSYDELKVGYEEAAKNSPTGTVICEKFVENKAVGVFYSISGDEITFAGSEDKTPIRYPKQGSYVAGFFSFPSVLEHDFRNRYEDKIKAMFKSIGLYEGSIWIEVFHDGDEYYFNEVGYRYGGSISVYPVDYLSGINQIYRDLYYAISGKHWEGKTPALVSDKFQRGEMYCVYPIHIHAGVVAKYEGLDELRNEPSMVIFSPTKAIGTEVKDTGSFAQIVALAHFVFKTKEECVSMVNHIHDTFKVIDDNGNNLVNRMLTEEELYAVNMCVEQH